MGQSGHDGARLSDGVVIDQGERVKGAGLSCKSKHRSVCESA